MLFWSQPKNHRGTDLGKGIKIGYDQNMENLIEFLLKAGEVKCLKQRGLVLRGVKDPVTVGAHSFRTAIMGWVLARAGNSGLDGNRIIKIVLVHDLIAGYAGDLTPYEPLLSQHKTKKIKKIFERWIRIPVKKKHYFYNIQRAREQKSLKELSKYLPKSLALEIEYLWKEWKEGLTREGRFVQQVDMLENFIQSLEYWKVDKKFPIDSWWQETKQLISDPLLIKFLEALDKKFYSKK